MNLLPNINSLRFFLALMVFLYHVPQFCKNRGFPYFDGLPLFHKGTEAVYVFFSLSGFLIIRQLYHEKISTNKINLKQFYLNRILRIFPLYYLILIIGFLYYEFILPQMGFASLRQYELVEGFLLGATFFANVLATYEPGGILEILWSLSIEEQFYIMIAPVFAWILPKRILPILIIFTILYFLVYHIDELGLIRKYKMLYYYFSFSGVIAILSLKHTKIKFPSAFRIFIIGILIIYFTTSIFSKLPSFYYQLFSAILFPISIWVLASQPLPLMNNNTLSYLGKISYGIYMYHALTFQLFGLLFIKFFNPNQFNSIVFLIIFYGGCLSLTIVISHFSYQYFEKYFLKMKNKYRKNLN